MTNNFIKIFGEAIRELEIADLEANELYQFLKVQVNFLLALMDN